jgi:hypothetical protein
MIRSLPLQKALHNPTCLSAIASLLVHGLLWGVLPILPLASAEPDEPEIQRQVGLIELTPEELSRLPDFAAAPSSIAPMVPLLLPDASTSTVPNFTLTPLPPQPPIPYGSFPFFPQPSERSFRTEVPSTRQPRSTTPTTRRPAAPSPSPSVAPRPEVPINEAPTDLDNSRTTELRELDGLQAAAPEPLEATAEPEDNSPPVNNADENAETDAASNSDAPRSGDAATAPSPPSPIDLARAEQQRLRRLYARPNLEGTTDEEANSAYGSWMNEIGRAGEDQFDEYQRLNLSLPQPRESCAFIRQNVTATYGVLMNADNDLEGEPRLLKRSGYTTFDDQAKEVVATYDFNNESGEPRVYLVNVTFTYSRDRCPAVTAPPGNAS